MRVTKNPGTPLKVLWYLISSFLALMTNSKSSFKLAMRIQIMRPIIYRKEYSKSYHPLNILKTYPIM